MRIQRLQIGAFGPFADPVTLDFEALNEAGLFLLTGPNGAGKSSVLDAVCFALYGQIPGDRGGAKRYRSDHAGPGQAPIVELEATFAQGSYRIVRTAAWERPRKRGTGTTPQQATVSLSRRVGDGWEPVTTRLDEAGQLVTRLVGMNFVQFCQVVILPQGKFQAFLRATADDRRALLQQLFHTGRFQRVEAWLRDHRLELGRRSRDHHDAIREVLDRISEAADSPLPETAATDGLTWVDLLLADTGSAVAADAAALTEATAVEAATRAALQSGRELAAKIGRHRAGLSELAELEAGADGAAGLRERLSAARRAAPVVALAPLVRTRESQLIGAESDSARAAARVHDLLGERPADLPAVAAELTRAARRFDTLRPRATEAEALVTEMAECGLQRQRLDARAAELAEAGHDAAAAELTETMGRIRAAETRLPVVEALLSTARERLAAHAEVTALMSSHAAAATELWIATEQVLTAKEAWLTVREARIEGMAAELAGRLAVGADCPVCGSADHPHPASSRLDSPDAATEESAQKALDDAKTAEFAHTTRVRELLAQLDHARARTGGIGADDLAAAVTDHSAEATVLGALVATAERTEAALTLAGQRVTEARAEEQRLREHRVALDSRQQHASARLAVIDSELAAALDPTPYDELEQAIADTRDRLDAVTDAGDAEEALTRARGLLAEASGAFTVAALEAGFDSAADAEAARLPAPQIDEAATRLRAHDARLAAVRSVLADPDLVEAADSEPPDEASLRATHDRAVVALTDVTARRERSTRRHARLTTLRADLADRLTAWTPLLEELELVTHLSQFCEGKSPDNRWQMQLSAYVVAWRLSQVADAANVRLAAMTHGRYSLEHTDERGAGERRGGLGLVVRDDWTGVTRDPVTLSGGETFVVALALALGLADVITAEAGGATLQTLFVDEGFGSLDSTSLDEVLDTLDSLRASGRTVGVVSHVAEMRSRIPAQLQVRKPSAGGPSTVRMRV
jgi:exonuclease SbcC